MIREILWVVAFSWKFKPENAASVLMELYPFHISSTQLCLPLPTWMNWALPRARILSTSHTGGMGVVWDVCRRGRRAEFLPPGSLSEISRHISSFKANIMHQVDTQFHEHFPRHLPLISVLLTLNYLCYKFNIGLLYLLVVLTISWWQGVFYVTLHPLVLEHSVSTYRGTEEDWMLLCWKHS